MSRDVLFFDLDGTLIDSAVGITRCVAYALEKMDQPVPGDAELRKWIGPALRTSFAPVFGDAVRVERAVELYRERFDQHGWQEHDVYAGIGEVVQGLHAAGHRLAVVTAKNEPHARRIVEHLPFGGCFEDVVGATEDGVRSHKPELIAEALQRLSLASGQCWMIGDRRMDIEGARHHGMRNVGVLWGFGGREELTAAGAGSLADTPAELARLLSR
ncbi:MULTISPECIES: HAD hydrolase-like protein [Stenotrophomonas]|uniref:HAD family hydrolase n=1 Tax=Stenotrophomonas nitritireducens TaxID=83617 RepID=A0ABR5NLQ7_9GAMM|nr:MULTISPECIES: HAD hydrolase-like protein [Stenotrophomonas]KQN96528.1 HAD family hydrolase [Stenotrophomonas sp. Leaf70]KRG58806.1 HAD family hydrolase [Stenotrophomonas nitritireducens]MBN8792515.1 HAD hydrolase-like protein [Stenotrophomonas nitritireducens]MBN8797009.1 HAD hydrolase-like protein [Stenotrophomonas nitritireducens]